VNFSTQTHDFNPGFGAPVNAQGDATFWTIGVPDSAVKFDLKTGRTELHVHDLEIEDYFNFPNAAADGDSVEATVSFDVVWSGLITRRVNVTDAANGFAGKFLENQVTVSWSASNERGFSFVANPGSFATSVPEVGPFAQIGYERNGTFFTSLLAPPTTSAQAQSGQDQVFAALLLSVDNTQAHQALTGVHASSAALAPRKAAEGGSALLPESRGLQGSEASFTAQHAARDRVFAFASDLNAPSMSTAVGLLRSEVLFP
jgi:hypothetical protein